MRCQLQVNGNTVSIDVEPRTTLLDALRDNLKLTGTHVGCEHGVCGACTVLVDGEPARACLILAAQAHTEANDETAMAITTIEGLSPAPGELNVVQDAFCEAHGLQCGYCTPGMIVTVTALLEHNPNPSRDDIVDAISANLCRCTGYGQIIEAIELAAEKLRQGKTSATAGDV